MLRIESEADATSQTTIRATGRLTGPWVDELRRSLQSLNAETSVVLDLTDVSFVDRDGLELLRTLKQDRRVFLRCSAFVNAQLM